MRISTSWAQQMSINNMQTQQASLNKTQMQLSTGLKLQTPSDDPVAATKALSLQATIDQNGQYLENINVAKTNNTLEDNTLSTMIDALKRARDLAVQGLNEGALSSSDKKDIGQEVQQILGNITTLSNTTNTNGEYIFSGYQSKTPTYAETTPATATSAAVYTYQGGTEQRMLQVSQDLQIANGDPGSAIFEYSGTNILNTLSDFSFALANSNPGLANTNPASDQSRLNKVLGELDTAIQQITDNQAKAGARVNALDTQIDQNNKFTVDLKGNLSNVQDLDYADAISRFNQQQMVLQAAQQSFSKVQKLSLFDYL